MSDSVAVCLGARILTERLPGSNPASASPHVPTVPEARQNLNHEGFIQRFGGFRLMEISMMNLYFHMQCDYFVGTRMSNWCRLIDELRLTGDKFDCPMIWLNGAASTGNI